MNIKINIFVGMFVTYANLTDFALCLFEKNRNERKRKQTPSRTGMRRAQTMKYSTKNIVEDKKSGEYRLSHHLDLKTGMYKGRQVLDPKE